MDDRDALTSEDDLFGRIALFNKLVTLGQLTECTRQLADEIAAGRTRHSLASVLIEKGYLAPRAAQAVEQAVRNKVAAEEGEKPPAAPGLEPEPKPMKKRAPSGESQVLAAVGRGDKRARERFVVTTSPAEESATLRVKSGRLTTGDTPVLEAGCRRLVATGQPRLFIDLTQVAHVPSSTIA